MSFVVQMTEPLLIEYFFTFLLFPAEFRNRKMYSKTPLSSASTTDPTIASIITKTTTQNVEDTINSSDLDYWANAIEDDLLSGFPFDADSGFWDGKFVPPPPRPPFLEDSIASDGLTTCDLCSWAWKDKGIFSLDGALSEFFARRFLLIE